MTDAKDARIAELESTLRDVLGHFRASGHISWQLNHCDLITNEKFAGWCAVVGVTPAWSERD